MVHLFFTEDHIHASDLHGENVRSLKLPVHRWANYNLDSSIVSPDKNLIAIPTLSHEGILGVWILKLPELEVVEILFVLVNADNASHPIWANLLRADFFEWSPDSTQLAFLASEEGLNSDLYVWNVQDQLFVQLTDVSDEYIDLLGWSPHSNYIAYVAASNYDEFGYVRTAIRVADSEVRETIELESLADFQNPIFREHLYGWVSNESFIVATSIFEAGTRDLRRISIVGQVIDLEPSFHCGFVLNQKHQMAYMYLCDFKGSVPSVAQGIYRKNLSDNSLHLVQATQPNNPFSYRWFAASNLLVIRDWENHIVTTYDYLGNKLAEFTGTSLFPSPDGQWMVVRNESELNLHDRWGKLIDRVSLIDSSGIRWLPDSSGLFILEGPTIIHYYGLGEDLVEDEMDLDVEFREFFIVQPE